VEGRAYTDVRDISVSLGTPCSLRARLRGRDVRVWRSQLKAATYHGATLHHGADGWRASLLLDV
jgi:SHS2 domain-containing protein